MRYCYHGLSHTVVICRPKRRVGPVKLNDTDPAG